MEESKKAVTTILIVLVAEIFDVVKILSHVALSA